MIKYYLKEGCKEPERKHKTDSGMDVYACVEEPIIINPNETRLIPTGLFLKIPEGYEVVVRSRSGLSAKHGVFVLNSPGTIDSGYEGEVKVILTNLGTLPFKVTSDLRIAQLVVQKVYLSEWERLSEYLKESERGSGGFGSTDKN